MTNPEGSNESVSGSTTIQSDEQILAHSSQHLQAANANGDLIFKEKLEYGSTGVWLGLLHETDVIMKAVKKPVVRNSPEHIDAAREVAMLMALEHPNIIDYKGCLITGDGVLWIVMGFCSKKTLHQRISSSGISANYAMRCAIDVAHALEYLHKTKNIVHNNLRSENLFLNVRGRIKLGGFGLARLPGLKKRIGSSGEPPSVAPEIQQENTPPTPKSDIYLFGHLLRDIFPIETNSGSESQRQRCALTKRCMRLASQCQNDDPNKRPSIKQVVEELEAIRKGPGSNQKPKSFRGSEKMRSHGCMVDCWEDFLGILSCGVLGRTGRPGHSGYTRLLESEQSEENRNLLAGLHIPPGVENMPHNIPEGANTILKSPEILSMRDLEDFNGSKDSMNSMCPIMTVDFGPPRSEQRVALQNYIGEHLRPDHKRLPEFGAFLSANLLDCQEWRELVAHFFGPRTQAFRSSHHWRVMKKFFLKQVIPSISGSAPNTGVV